MIQPRSHDPQSLQLELCFSASIVVNGRPRVAHRSQHAAIVREWTMQAHYSHSTSSRASYSTTLFIPSFYKSFSSNSFLPSTSLQAFISLDPLLSRSLLFSRSDLLNLKNEEAHLLIR